MANEKRLDLIDRQELIKAAQKKLFGIGDNTHPYKAVEIVGKYFRELVDNAPTVDAVEVVHGHWDEGVNNGYCCCSNCRDVYILQEWLTDGKWNYCPNCGAKMDGGVKNA